MRSLISVNIVVVLVMSACGSHQADADARVPLHADRDTTIVQNGASLFVPAGSIDHDTTARITHAFQTPPGGAAVAGFDFDVGTAKILKPVTLTLPVFQQPVMGTDSMTLVPFLSGGQWGTEMGRYNPNDHTVTLTVNHLSWYGDMAQVIYQGLRKLLAEKLAHFRGAKPNCAVSGPRLSYPLATMLEPPILACVSGDQSSGSLKIVNNRGFYLMVNPLRGLSLEHVSINGVLDAATAEGGAAIRYVARWNSLPLPPGASAEFRYQPVAGGPALSFEPDGPATFVAEILKLFSGISDLGSIILEALGCIRSIAHAGATELDGCIADALVAAADRGSIGAGQSIKVLGLTVSRSMLGLLSLVIKAIPELDIVIESRDGGSASTIQIDAVPVPAGGTGLGTPATTPPPIVPPPPPANRYATASYDRLAAGAAHAEWYQAWQDFSAATNTITRLAVNVGDTRWAPGPIPVNTSLRLCRDAACTQQLGAWSAQINNYGATVVDIGDFAVQKGATYYLRYDRPDSAHSWAVYFWGPGTYNNLSVSIYGYSR
jgi:hypothetical protein